MYAAQGRARNKTGVTSVSEAADAVKVEGQHAQHKRRRVATKSWAELIHDSPPAPVGSEEPSGGRGSKRGRRRAQPPGAG